MRTLFLLRHAKSSWDDPALADHDRPLSPRGRRDSRLIAEHMRREELEPELVLCSSAARTRETLELVRPALGGASVVVEDKLYAASSDLLLRRLRQVPDEVRSAMLIGHNPGLEQLAIALASSGDELGRLEEKFPTAALATLASRGTWASLAPGTAALTGYVVPKQLR